MILRKITEPAAYQAPGLIDIGQLYTRNTFDAPETLDDILGGHFIRQIAPYAYGINEIRTERGVDPPMDLEELQECIGRGVTPLQRTPSGKIIGGETCGQWYTVYTGDYRKELGVASRMLGYCVLGSSPSSFSVEITEMALAKHIPERHHNYPIIIGTLLHATITDTLGGARRISPEPTVEVCSDVPSREGREAFASLGMPWNARDGVFRAPVYPLAAKIAALNIQRMTNNA